MKISTMAYLLAMTLFFHGHGANAHSAGPALHASAEPLEIAAASGAPDNQKGLRSPDVVFVPTPHAAVEAMLRVTKVGKADVVYDLGSGDGRIPIMAVQRFNADRAVGIDIDPQRIKEAEANLKAAGVGDRVRFVLGDLFQADISQATVVTLYLLPSLNLKVLPKLLTELKPGTRIASHAFDMGTWAPEQTLRIDGSAVYFWTIPAKGTPEYDAAMGAAKQN